MSAQSATDPRAGSKGTESMTLPVRPSKTDRNRGPLSTAQCSARCEAVALPMTVHAESFDPSDVRTDISAAVRGQGGPLLGSTADYWRAPPVVASAAARSTAASLPE
ncbi:hypothetical protein OG596_01390 [Streptomyces sp. NBC_01102]|nr:hypothetical protein OG596_01390 [Streptomyces sp. NBC_01102]